MSFPLNLLEVTEEEVTERRLFAHYNKAEAESERLLQNRKKMAPVLTRYHKSEGEGNW